MRGGAITSDELAFIAALDAEPGDHTTRLVYADWLDDRDDPRGPGMRALGRLGLVPKSPDGFSVWWWARRFSKYESVGAFVLPADWYDKMTRTAGNTWSPGDRLTMKQIASGHHLASRAAAEDAAALAWAKLTPEQQARILADAGVMV